MLEGTSAALSTHRGLAVLIAATLALCGCGSEAPHDEAVAQSPVVGVARGPLVAWEGHRSEAVEVSEPVAQEGEGAEAVEVAPDRDEESATAGQEDREDETEVATSEDGPLTCDAATLGRLLAPEVAAEVARQLDASGMGRAQDATVEASGLRDGVVTLVVRMAPEGSADEGRLVRLRFDPAVGLLEIDADGRDAR